MTQLPLDKTLSSTDCLNRRESTQVMVQTEDETRAFARTLITVLQPSDVLYLEGDLGTGKTFLSQSLIRELGYQGKVLSPTYSLVQTYEVQLSVTYPQLHSEAAYNSLDETDPNNTAIQLHHFDLYRLADPLELEYIGLRDYLNQNSICLIEWPSKGAGVLPPASITVSLAYNPDNPHGRHISVEFASQPLTPHP